MFIQEALQFFTHILHPTHLLLSIAGRKMENLATKLRMVPTGQIVLQYVLPFLHASTIRIMRVIAAIANVDIDLIHTSL